MESSSLTIDQFNRCILEIVEISNKLLDGWSLNELKGFDNGKYISKKVLVTLGGQNISYEYHVVFSLSYSVPVICFNVWRSDGTMISMEDYWRLNKNFEDSNLYNSLTQLDHPVLCRPFLTLHPCKTQEIIEPFLTTSKNPVISWLSIMGPFIHLKLLEDYFKYC